MSLLVLFNKPFHVLCRFTDQQGRKTLADFLPIADIYPAGRLDYDSEGLLILTADGRLQKRISDPCSRLWKTYLVQVEGIPQEQELQQLCRGILLRDGKTRPAQAEIIPAPDLWERVPPIRYRRQVPTSWLRLSIHEGRNRQVRRMTAALGYPTLRLIRVAIGPWQLGSLQPGQWRSLPCQEMPNDRIDEAHGIYLPLP